MQKSPLPTQKSPSPRLWGCCVLLVFAITFFTHARSLSHGFSDFDDPAFVTEVTGYRGLAPANIAWDFTTVANGHWQPLTYLSYGVDFSLWKMSPAGFHLTNILIHAVNAMLVALLARSLIVNTTLARGGPSVVIAASCAGLLFGVHPLRVESVAWVTERRDVLSTLFLLIATLSYARHAHAGLTASKSKHFWLALLFLVLSLLSKAWGMTFFVVLLIIDVFPLARLPALPWRWTRAHLPVLLEKLPFAALGIAAAGMAAYAQSASAGTVRTLEQWGIVERGTQAAYGLFFYLWKTVWPTSLAALYDLPPSLTPTEPRFAAAIACVAAGLIAVVALRRRAPGLVAAALCYAVLVSPVLGIFQSGIQLVADRYSYIATIPFAMLAGWGLAKVAERRGSRAPVLAAAAVMIAALAVAAWVQTGHWRTTDATFQRVLDEGYDGPMVRLYLGRQSESSQRPDEAITHYQRSIDFGDPEGEAHFALANILRARGDLSGAERAYVVAAERRRDKLPVYLGLGIIAVHQDRYPQAVAAFRAAVTEFERPGRAPEPQFDGVAYLNLAMALDLSGDLRASREFLVKALRYPATRQEADRLLKITDEELRQTGGR